MRKRVGANFIREKVANRVKQLTISHRWILFFFFPIHRDEEFGTIFTVSIISALIKSETRFNEH